MRARRAARPRWQRILIQRGLPSVALVGAIALLVGLIFAGSAAKLAPGVTIAGIDVGGLTPHQARALLARRERALANTPVVFTAGSRTWKIRPAQLFNNRSLEKLFGKYESVKFFLTRERLREVIIKV